MIANILHHILGCPHPKKAMVVCCVPFRAELARPAKCRDPVLFASADKRFSLIVPIASSALAQHQSLTGRGHSHCLLLNLAEVSPPCAILTEAHTEFDISRHLLVLQTLKEGSDTAQHMQEHYNTISRRGQRTAVAVLTSKMGHFATMPHVLVLE